MKLKDILTKPTEISWRILLNEKNAKSLGTKDIFAGVCEWNGKKLISTDGDSYSVDDEIVGFLKMSDHLVYWTKEED